MSEDASIAMTPTDCYNLLSEMVGEVASTISSEQSYQNIIAEHVQENTESSLVPVMASSGLSVQYSIFMGFVHKVKSEHPSKKIKFVIPPNCYGGTNDQARRIAAIDPNIDILDIPVDGDRDMVSSLDAALEQVAAEDSVGIVLAEIPTNPRVEVPNMEELGNTLRKPRTTDDGRKAEPIVFTVDQTFCPNVPLLGTKSPLNGVQTISYVSCSKFPSGGECTGGYAIGNIEAEELLKYVSAHMVLTDNQATGEQMMLISRNIPSMNDRIEAAYKNTVQFVNHIKTILPDAKLNFVSDRVAKLGFTPSVFSLELPATGKTPDEQEIRRRQLNKDFIEYMISQNPNQCKHCVSYGQLKGSYWTIPATSTQGTTKEADKDYIIRVSLSPEVDVEALSSSFTTFCAQAQF